MTEKLPIHEVLPEIKTILSSSNRLVVQAPPGAGKTTALPLEFLGESWLGKGKIIMLEPRRIAARSAARWMARTLDEKVGETVGYSVHLESRVSEKTVIEVVTEGVFVNRLLADSSQEGISMVIFDEFHERSVDADFSLALTREAQEVLREDLKILVMSATLDAAPVAAYLRDAPLVTSEGRSFPVAIEYRKPEDNDLLSNTFKATLHAIQHDEGSILVFLPGAGEIKNIESRLKERLGESIPVFPLYGNLSAEEQEKAIEPAAPGTRKIVLATPVAESSITIKGVRVVIDSGLVRVARFNPRTGMDILETEQISSASADQRAGRAGRIEPGKCYRLWNQSRRLEPWSVPAVMREDLSSLVLNLARWGYKEIADLPWLTEPDRNIFRSAGEMLKSLGALDDRGITDKGKRISRMPLHPRLGAMFLEGEKLNCPSLAADLAALLSERDIISYGNIAESQSDILLRLEVLEGKSPSGARVDRAGVQRVREYSRSLHPGKDREKSKDSLGDLLLSAYPDRIARKRGESSYQLANGDNAVISEGDALAYSDYLVVPALGGTGRVPRIFLAAAVSEKEIFTFLRDRIVTSEQLDYIKEKGKFRAVRTRRLGHLILKEEPLSGISQEDFHKALLNFLGLVGLKELNWSDETEKFRQRVDFLRSRGLPDFPDMSDGALSRDLDWLLPYLGGITIKNSLSDIPLLQALQGMISWKTLKDMENLAPTHLTVPSGSRLPLDYSGNEPVLKVRIQEMFGLAETPSVCRGTCPVTIHLLSPASRPIQITGDLKSFWDNTYSEVKKDLKGRYPKHYWPDDPYQAEATSRTKKRMG